MQLIISSFSLLCHALFVSANYMKNSQEYVMGGGLGFSQSNCNTCWFSLIAYSFLAVESSYNKTYEYLHASHQAYLIQFPLFVLCTFQKSISKPSYICFSF